MFRGNLGTQAAPILWVHAASVFYCKEAPPVWAFWREGWGEPKWDVLAGRKSWLWRVSEILNVHLVVLGQEKLPKHPLVGTFFAETLRFAGTPQMLQAMRQDAQVVEFVTDERSLKGYDDVHIWDGDARRYGIKS